MAIPLPGVSLRRVIPEKTGIAAGSDQLMIVKAISSTGCRKNERMQQIMKSKKAMISSEWEVVVFSVLIRYWFFAYNSAGTGLSLNYAFRYTAISTEQRISINNDYGLTDFLIGNTNDKKRCVLDCWVRSRIKSRR